MRLLHFHFKHQNKVPGQNGPGCSVSSGAKFPVASTESALNRFSQSSVERARGLWKKRLNFVVNLDQVVRFKVN